MFLNYFKIVLRNIFKYKFFSAINILGLTIGLTACLFILLYISDELSYDKFHINADRIYLVGLHGKIGGQEVSVMSTDPPMAAVMVAEIPEVESATRLENWGQQVVRYEDKSFTEEKIYFADSNFFDFFSFELLEGDPETALKEPNTAVITSVIARKYFDNEPALGNLLAIGENHMVKITGIAKPAPHNSHLLYNMLISSETSWRMKNEGWMSNFVHTYFTLQENGDINKLNAGYESIVEKYIGPRMESYIGTSLKTMKEQGATYGYFNVRLTDLHFRHDVEQSPEPPGNFLYIYFFGCIGLFILVIACINFMNLSTARSAGRAREVGLRKTLGSLRGQMIKQFLSESMLYSFIAVLLSLVACYALLPYFNTLSGKSLDMHVFRSSWFMISIVVLTVWVGLISGSYPAFYLTSFSAVEALKGKVRAGMKSKSIRSALVVFQFALSIFLIIFTAVVYMQLQYMQKNNTGIDKHNILIVSNADRLGNNRNSFRDELMKQSGVVNTSYTNNTFPGVNNSPAFREPGSDQYHLVYKYYADYEHQEVMKFEMKEGRFFSRDFPSDSSAVVVNEAALREFSFKENEVLNAEILYREGDAINRYRIIGVMKNFNFESFRMQVRPLAILLAEDSQNLLIRYTGNPGEIVDKVATLWKKQTNNEPFDYEFLDQRFDKLYKDEQRMGTVFSVFSGLAVFIACLGLFALSAFTIEQRTKEIGIRKTFGATPLSLTILLSKEFMRLVLIAFVPAATLGWYISGTWLQGFVYRIEINPLLLLASGLTAIVIAWLTVGYQSVKAANSNSVDSLRYE